MTRFSSTSLIGGVVAVSMICLIAVAQGQPPLRVGASVSQTGSLAALGRNNLRGYQLCVKHANEKGGLLGRRIELLVEDDQSQGSTAVAIYEKLIAQDKVDAILGPYSSPITEAVADVSEKHRMPMVAAGAAATSIFKKGRKFVFMVIPPAEGFFEGLIDLAASRGLKTVAILNEDTLFPKATAQGTAELAQRKGLQVVLAEAYPKGTTDFTALLRKVRAASPDVLAAATYFDDAVAITRQAKELNVNPKMYALTAGAVLPKFYELLGPTAEFVYVPSQWEPELVTLRAGGLIPIARQYPGAREFVESYRKEFHGAELSYHAAQAYGGCQVFIEAVKRAGSLDRETVRDAILKLDFNTVYGAFKVDRDGLQIGHKMLIFQWQGGKKVIVWPEELAPGKPRFPTRAVESTTMSTFAKALIAGVMILGPAIDIVFVAEAQPPIRIGVSASKSGTYAALGQNQLRGYQLCVKDANDKGGVLGRKVELVVDDDKSQAANAIAIYERLITQEKVDLALGPYGTPMTEPVVPLIEKYRMPMVASTSATTSLFRGRKFIFMVYSTADVYLEGFVELAARKGLKTIALLNEDSIAMRVMVTVASGLAKKRGLQVVFIEHYPRGTTDFSAVLTRVRATAPDAFAVATFFEDAVTITRQTKELNLNPKMFALTVGSAQPKFYEMLGRAAEFVYGPTQWEPELVTTRAGGLIPIARQYPGAREFVEAHHREYPGADLSYQTAAGYAGCQVLTEAAKRAGSLDRDKIRDAILKLDFNTVFGAFKVDGDGVQIAHKMVLFQWQDGKRVIIWPEELAPGKPRFPTPPWSQR